MQQNPSDISIQAPQGNRITVPGLPFEPDLGAWQCTDRGVSLYGKVACGVPVLLTGRTVRVGGGAPDKLTLSFPVDGVWRHLTVLPSQIADPAQLVKLSDQGLPINRRMAGLLSDYLIDFYTFNLDRLPVSHGVARLGWLGLGSQPLFSPYLDHVVPDIDPEYRSLMEGIHCKGDYAAWLKAARSLRAESVPLRILMAASFASALVKPLNALPFFCHLWGPTGCGKTVALKAAASIWGDPNSDLIKTFNGTSIGFERTAHFLNSLPFCIDELQLARKEKGKPVFNPYELAQGQGRLRGTKNGGVEPMTEWALSILTTGEGPLNPETGGAGARNRVIDLHWNRSDHLMHGPGRYAEVFEQNYGWAGERFADMLCVPGNLEQVKTFFRFNMEELAESDATGKQALAAALILTADQLACYHMFDPRKDEDPNEVVTAPPMVAEDILPYLATNEQVMVGPRAYEYLTGWVARERSRFNPRNPTGPTYGVVEDGWAYIIASVFNATCREVGFDPDAARAELKTMGKLKCREGLRTVNKRINGVLVTCVALKMPAELPDPDPIEDEFIPLPDDADDPFAGRQQYFDEAA